MKINVPADLKNILTLKKQDDKTKAKKAVNITLDVNKFSLAMGRLMMIGNDRSIALLAMCMPEFKESIWGPEYVQNIVPQSFVETTTNSRCSSLYIATINHKVKVKRLKHFKIRLDNVIECKYDSATGELFVSTFHKTVFINCFIGPHLIQQNPQI